MNYRDEFTAHRQAQADAQLDGFGWPEAPPAASEQRVLPIEGTIEASYRHWRATEHGQQVYAAFCAEAMGEVARGATRLSGKGTWERMRARLRVPLNNSFTALVVRDAEADHPTLRGLFETRQRKAS